MSELLLRAIRSLESDPDVIASALAAYRRRHALGDDAIAAWLGCDVTDVPRLALCRRPDRAGAGFAEMVARIAAFVPCDRERLRTLLEETAPGLRPPAEAAHES